MEFRVFRLYLAITNLSNYIDSSHHDVVFFYLVTLNISSVRYIAFDLTTARL